MDIKRAKELDFLKAIATILIVCHHYQQIFDVKFKYLNFFNGKFFFGYLVELFFIISGICAYKWTTNMLESLFFKFYYARLCRLLPLMAISIVIDAGVIWIFKSVYHISISTAEVNLKNIIISCLGMQSGWFFENPGINNPMWYVSVLLLCYIIMYFVTWLAKVLKIRPYILYAAVISIGVLIVTLHLNYPFLNNETSRGYLTFFLGLCMGRLFEEKDVKDLRTQLIAISVLIIGIFAYIKDIYAGYAIVFLIWPSVIVLLKARQLKSFVNLNVWTKIACISFSVYVWHTPLMHLVKGCVQNGVFFKMNNVVGLILVIISVEIIGFISHRVIEKPIGKIMKTMEEKINEKKQVNQ